MKGTTRKNGKTWQFVYDGPPRENGKRQQRTKSGFRLQRDAQVALRAAIAAEEAAIKAAEEAAKSGGEPHGDEGTPPPSRLLGEWLADTWLPARGGLKTSTRVGYESIVRVHIAPDPIGRMRLSELTVDDLDEFFIRLTEKPGKAPGENLSGKTRKNIWTVLQAALKQAVKRKLIPGNPLDGVEQPLADKPEVLAWKVAEIREFLGFAAAESSRFEPLYKLSLATGLRRGEVAGLKWHDINFETNKLAVSRCLLYAGGKVYYETTKTSNADRTISLNPACLEALHQMKAIQEADAQAAGDTWIDTGAIFTTPQGEPLHPDFITRQFRRDTERAGVRYIRFHGLRHTFATIALALGKNPKAVSEVLGHGNVTITLRLYSQYLPGIHDSIMDAIQNGLFETPSDQDVIRTVTIPPTTIHSPDVETRESPAVARDSEEIRVGF